MRILAGLILIALLLVAGFTGIAAYNLFSTGEGFAAAGGFLLCFIAVLAASGVGIMAMLDGVARTEDVRALIAEQRNSTQAITAAIDRLTAAQVSVAAPVDGSDATAASSSMPAPTSAAA